MKSPIGMATAMAMAEMTRVPRNTGTAPKAPAPAIWSGADGDLRLPAQAEEELVRRHQREERPGLVEQRGDDAGGGQDRHDRAEDHEDRRAPRSTPLRARKRGARRRAGEEEAERASPRAPRRTARGGRSRCHAVSRSAAAATSGVGSAKMRPAATLWISERISWRPDASSPAVRSSGRLRQSSAVDDAALEHEPEQDQDQRRARRPRSRRRRRDSSAASAAGSSPARREAPGASPGRRSRRRATAPRMVRKR